MAQSAKTIGKKAHKSATVLDGDRKLQARAVRSSAVLTIPMIWNLVDVLSKTIRPELRKGWGPGRNDGTVQLMLICVRLLVFHPYDHSL